MLGSAVEPVTMATRPENRLLAPVAEVSVAELSAPIGDVGAAGAMQGILSQDDIPCHVVRDGRRSERYWAMPST